MGNCQSWPTEPCFKPFWKGHLMWTQNETPYEDHKKRTPNKTPNLLKLRGPDVDSKYSRILLQGNPQKGNPNL